MDTIKSYLTKWFVTDWKTTFWGFMAILPQMVSPLETYLTSVGVSQKWLNFLSLLFAFIFALEAKSGDTNVVAPPQS